MPNARKAPPRRDERPKIAPQLKWVFARKGRGGAHENGRKEPFRSLAPGAAGRDREAGTALLVFVVGAVLQAFDEGLAADVEEDALAGHLGAAERRVPAAGDAERFGGANEGVVPDGFVAVLLALHAAGVELEGEAVLRAPEREGDAAAEARSARLALHFSRVGGGSEENVAGGGEGHPLGFDLGADECVFAEEVGFDVCRCSCSWSGS